MNQPPTPARALATARLGGLLLPLPHSPSPCAARAFMPRTNLHTLRTGAQLQQANPHTPFNAQTRVGINATKFGVAWRKLCGVA
jgi:hypothetical protein